MYILEILLYIILHRLHLNKLSRHGFSVYHSLGKVGAVGLMKLLLLLLTGTGGRILAGAGRATAGACSNYKQREMKKWKLRTTSSVPS